MCALSVKPSAQPKPILLGQSIVRCKGNDNALESEAMKCAHCKFWNESVDVRLTQNADYLQNQCRRRAPIIDKELGGRSVWPMTQGTDFCGDFEIVPELRHCLTCDARVGSTPMAHPLLQHATMYPICKKCHDQFLDGTHPYLKPPTPP